MMKAIEDLEQGSVTDMNLAVTCKKDWGGESWQAPLSEFCKCLLMPTLSTRYQRIKGEYTNLFI